MYKFISVLAVCCVTLSCDKTTKTIPVEGITTLRLVFSQPGGNKLTYEFKDIDGIGGADPVADEIRLPPLNVFDCTVELLNESVTPVKDWSATVRARADIHLLLYSATNDVLRFSNLDTDANGRPFGMKLQVASKTGSGSMKVVLKHEVDKTSDNPSATGVTDVEAVFPVKI